ncbi:hormogonium polysaccharide biosynthesis glycosyltransferase HpsP [Leptolyngbya sp. PCC 6406]|uniref:hormogonium polysaccharide biosynthesis glycosyltransferase HpsP n=1 Tax=Leptolyngbya sp. PCC 6406 TaxID=1173264 RepID=UPI0002AC3098|nr:hormogonium polysaccharide biosynthesis glycosyltransferase HpsP [Leptolyngbya sp. PCC 6406]
MTQPRVLHIVPSISLVYGGPSQMVRGFAAALANAGAEVTVATTDANGDVDEVPLDVPLGTPVSEEGYQVLYFRCAPFRRYKFSPGLLHWLWHHVRDYDIVHIHALFSPISSAAATLTRWRGVPYLLRPLGTLDPADLAKKRRLKQIYAALVERANLAGAAAIHFTSQQEAEVSERFGTQPLDAVLPLGVSPLPPGAGTVDIRDRYGIPPERPLILFMSRLDPKKGLDLLIPALETLHQEGWDFQFLLCGANPQNRDYEQQICQHIADSSLQARTTITGFVSGELKTALIQAADLFVLPSYYENFGIAVAEAMLAGLPVVISDQVYIWRDIQTGEAGWVCPCDREALTASLRSALKDPEERRRRGQRAIQVAQTHYSWPAIAQQAIALYDILRSP